MWTNQDLADIETAIKTKAGGDGVVQTSKSDKSIKYAETELSDLLKLRDLMRKELGIVKSGPAFNTGIINK